MPDGPPQPPSQTPQAPIDPDAPVAVRRHADRCFFASEETVLDADGQPTGYIVDGILWPMHDIAETRPIDDPAGTCDLTL
ncbi:MAG: hypothetical protein AAF750_04050 [Planctomycetota bacterium]